MTPASGAARVRSDRDAVRYPERGNSRFFFGWEPGVRSVAISISESLFDGVGRVIARGVCSRAAEFETVGAAVLWGLEQFRRRQQLAGDRRQSFRELRGN